jgi:hypothetical protein
VFLTVSDIRSGTNHPNAFPIGNKFYPCFGRILEKRSKGKNSQNILCQR